MTPSRVITDDVIEAMLRHEPVDPAFAPLAAFARHVPAVGDGPVPRPSDELAAMFEGRTSLGTADAPRALAATAAMGGTATTATTDAPSAEERARPVAPRLASLASKVAGLGLAAKIGLGTSLAAASVAGGGVAGVLPPAANDTVRDAIEAVSPVEFTDTGDEPRHSGDPASTGPSAGSGGTDSNRGDGSAFDDDAPAADRGPGASITGEPTAPPGGTVTTPTTGPPAAPGVPDDTPAATAPSTVPPAPPGDPGQGNPPQSVPSTVPPLEVDPTVTSTTPAAPSGTGS
jgi:hypothetical protein